MHDVILRALAALLVCGGLGIGALAPAFAEQGQTADFERGVLWEARWPGAAPSYLLGTIHSEDARVLASLSRSREAFDDSAHLLLEMTLDAATSARVVQGMLLPESQTLSSLTGEVLFARAAALVDAQGVNAAQLQRFKPWAVMLLLAMPEPKTGLFMDRMLYDAAVAARKRVTGLETPDEQVAVFDALPMADQLALLRAAVDSHASFGSLLEATTQAYLTGDLAALQRLYDEHMADVPDALVDAVTERLVAARNRRMAERLVAPLKQGNAFIAVGALHLPGKQGLLELLMARGFALRRLE